MKKILTALILLSAATSVFADNFNSISIQGQLTSSTPINGVQVRVLSAGEIVATASDINLVPDVDGVFSTQTYIASPWVFRTGSDYTMRLSTGTSPLTVISTFSITAVPFALTVRGDTLTENQNIFGAYGNVGVGTGTPLYRLEISSAAGSSEDIVVISTGGTPVIKMTGAGVIRANKYYGDGSSLTGITGAGDNLGNHTATQNLNLANFDITNVSTATFTGYINVTSNVGYEQGGGTILTSPGYSDLFLGYQAGYYDYIIPNYNTMVGFLAGNRNTSGYNNSFVGSQAGYSNEGGSANSFVGYAAGYSNTSGNYNSYHGNDAGYANTTGSRNSFFGYSAGQHNNGYSENTYLGYFAGYLNINGSNNTYVGSSAGANGGNANRNTFLGYQAGYNTNGGNNNIYIGYNAGYGNTSTSDSIILGYNQTSGGSSTLNIGGVLYGNLLAGTIGISRTTQGAALDVVSTGTASNQFAQIWRDSSGAIKSSMSATGEMMAVKFLGDGSGLTGITASGAVQKTGDTMTGQLTLSGSTLTVAGKDANGYSLSLSSGISMPAGTVTAGLFNGNGALLTALNASNLASGTIVDGRLSSNVNLLNANQTVTGQKTFMDSVVFPTRDKITFGNEIANSSAAILGTYATAQTTFVNCVSSLSITTGNNKIRVSFSGSVSNPALGTSRIGFRLNNLWVLGQSATKGITSGTTPGGYSHNMSFTALVPVAAGVNSVCLVISAQSNWTSLNTTDVSPQFFIEEVR